MTDTPVADKLHTEGVKLLKRALHEQLKELLPEEVDYAHWSVEWDIDGGVYFFIDGLSLYDKDEDTVYVEDDVLDDIQFDMFADICWMLNINDWSRDG